MRRLAVGTVLLALSACAAETPSDFADRAFPIPPGTPVRSLQHVPAAERSEDLLLQRDLVLREAFGEPFYRLEDVDIGPSGNIYVLDQSAQRVFIFDSKGQPHGAFGRAGPGPGEFMFPHVIAVVDDEIYLHSRRLARLSVFDLGGNHVADHSVPGSFVPVELTGLDASLFAVDAKETIFLSGGAPPRSGPWIVGRYSPAGELVDRLVEFEQTQQAYWSTDRGAEDIPVREASPKAALSSDAVYVTDGHDYQVLALGFDGDPIWALRVSYSAPEPDDRFKRALVEYGSSRRPGYGRTPADAGSYVWPERFAAIENLEADGHGNLYVFPHADRSPAEFEDVHRPVPVDVYSPEGERLFSGWSVIDGWDAAVGDQLYRIERDPDTEEYLVARYRLGVGRG